MAYLGRATLRNQLAAAQAARMATIDPDAFREYVHDVHRLTETPRQ